MPAPKGLGALALVDAEEAGQRLRLAIVDAGGSLSAAAVALGVHHATLLGWLRRLPGGGEFETCRAWVDARYPQRHNPRKSGRRRAPKKKDRRPS